RRTGGKRVNQQVEHRIRGTCSVGDGKSDERGPSAGGGSAENSRGRIEGQVRWKRRRGPGARAVAAGRGERGGVDVVDGSVRQRGRGDTERRYRPGATGGCKQGIARVGGAGGEVGGVIVRIDTSAAGAQGGGRISEVGRYRGLGTIRPCAVPD